MMQRNLALALVLMGAAALSGCGAHDDANVGANANNANAAGSPARQGAVETNTNIPANANRSSVPANTGRGDERQRQREYLRCSFGKR